MLDYLLMFTADILLMFTADILLMFTADILLMFTADSLLMLTVVCEIQFATGSNLLKSRYRSATP